MKLVGGDVGNRNLYCHIIVSHLTGNEMRRGTSSTQSTWAWDLFKKGAN